MPSRSRSSEVVKVLKVQEPPKPSETVVFEIPQYSYKQQPSKDNLLEPQTSGPTEEEIRLREQLKELQAKDDKEKESKTITKDLNQMQ